MSGAWIKLPQTHRATLPNGLTLIVVERPALPLVTLRLSLRAGSAHDPANAPGLAAFTARLLRHGAGRRDERAFAEDLDAIGGVFGAGIGLDQLGVDAEFTTETWAEGRELFLDALLRPVFDEVIALRERDRSLAEIEQSRDEPEHVASTAFLRFLYERHPYGHPAEGTARALAGFGAPQAREFWRGAMVPDGSVLVIVGDVKAADELARWRGDLASWKPSGRIPEAPADASPAAGGRVVIVHDEGARQAQWRTGNVGVKRRTPLHAKLVLANAILGGGFTSRLMQEIRVERGLTYGIGSRFSLPMALGPFEIASFTKNATLVQMHQLAADAVARFRRDGATKAELDAARAYVLGMYVRRFETPEGLAHALAEAEMHGLGEESITTFRDRIEAVDLGGLNAVLPELFPEHLLTVVVGDATQLEAPCAAIGAVSVVQPDFAEEMNP